MKVLHVDTGQDLDAGWDDIAPAAPAVDATVGPQPSEVDELDAGWEIESPILVPEKTVRRQRAKPILVTRVEPQSPVANSQVSLTKKARRELERQNRIHTAKRRAEAKAQKKEQRRTGQGEAKPNVPNARGKDSKVRASEDTAHSGLVRAKKRSHPKPAGKAARSANQQESDGVPSLDADLDAKPAATSVVARQAKLNPRSTKLWWVISILLLVIVALTFMWLRH